jgi:hypothetical protein
VFDKLIFTPAILHRMLLTMDKRIHFRINLRNNSQQQRFAVKPSLFCGHDLAVTFEAAQKGANKLFFQEMAGKILRLAPAQIKSVRKDAGTSVSCMIPRLYKPVFLW